jgi:hypothetical protein
MGKMTYAEGLACGVYVYYEAYDATYFPSDTFGFIYCKTGFGSIKFIPYNLPQGPPFAETVYFH